MLWPHWFRMTCPKCNHEINVIGAAKLQAAQLGVTCECPKCDFVWIFQTDSGEKTDSGNRPCPPRKYVSRVAAAQTKPIDETSAAYEPTVFVVDDNLAIRKSLKLMLECHGLNVETYACAEDILRVYDPSRPGCLLLDLHMPGMGGLALHQAILHTRSCIPVIFMTADAPFVAESLKNAAFDFFEKLFDPNVLLNRTRQAIEEHWLRLQSSAAPVRKTPIPSSDRPAASNADYASWRQQPSQETVPLS